MTDDARPTWSRDLLVDTAVELLHDGGPAAVTVDAVTRAAQVSRATLYRQFPSGSEMLAAAFGQVIPSSKPPPVTGPVDERLVAVLLDLAIGVKEAPLIVTAMCWVSIERGGSRLEDCLFADSGDGSERRILCQRLLDWCMSPLNHVFDSAGAAGELGVVDRKLAFALLVAPVLVGSGGQPRICAEAAVGAYLRASLAEMKGAPG